MIYDVCIVGAGAAGLVLAHDLVHRGRSVVVVEGGGVDGPRHNVEVVGKPHRGSAEGHALALGGTTTLWGGQLWPWEPYEFQARPHVAAWPIGYGDVAPFYDRALRVMGVPPSPFDARPARARGIALPHLDPERFAYKYSKWAGWRFRNLGRTLGRDLRKRSDVDVIVGERAVEIRTRGTTVTGIHTQGGGGGRTLQACSYVLAGGVLGTVRLLLASGGLGGAGWLGRGFMDHLSVRMGRFEPYDTRGFAKAFAPFYEGGILHTPRIIAQPGLVESENMMGVYGHWEAERPPDSGLSLVREGLRALQAGRPSVPSLDAVGRVLADLPSAVRIAYGISVRRRRPFARRTRFHLRVDVEQPPESVLALASDAAPPGDERLVLDWRVTEKERQSACRFADLLAGEFDRLGVGTFDPLSDPFGDGAGWGDRVADAYHMMGGTRMSVEPQDGVVNTDTRVHGVENLYVASASVFPSGGMANPTLTIMALALRLGHHLNHDVL